jgi:hypothetical protein
MINQIKQEIDKIIIDNKMKGRTKLMIDFPVGWLMAEGWGW